MVAEASKEFDKYLRSALGGQTDADVARLEQTRVDDFHKLVERLEKNDKTRKSKDLGKRRGKIDFDSEESEPLDSEDSDAKSNSESSEGESSDDEPIVKPLKGKNKKSKNKNREYREVEVIDILSIIVLLAYSGLSHIFTCQWL